MRQFLTGVVTALGLVLIIGWSLLYVGALDAAADHPHGSTVHALIEWARERAVNRAAVSIEPPADLARAERIRRGAGNYAAMCVECHLSPGVENSEIRRGLYPTPPNLARSAVADGGEVQMAARRFWIIKHGIKASGMPAWSKGGMDDSAIWDLVAFLDKLPSLSPADYQQTVRASDGHSHGGMEGAHADVTGDKGHQRTHDRAGPSAHSAHGARAHDETHTH